MRGVTWYASWRCWPVHCGPLKGRLRAHRDPSATLAVDWHFGCSATTQSTPVQVYSCNSFETSNKMPAAPTYIISRVADPIFGVLIGLSAAVTRINREEKDKGRTTDQTIQAGLRYVDLNRSGQIENPGTIADILVSLDVLVYPPHPRSLDAVPPNADTQIDRTQVIDSRALPCFAGTAPGNPSLHNCITIHLFAKRWAVLLLHRLTNDLPT